MSVTKAYDEAIDFIAAGPDSQRVAEYQASEATRARVRELVAREKAGEITADERSELDRALQLEHLMRMAKARARLLLQAR